MDSSHFHSLPPLTGLIDLYCERTGDGLLAEPWNLFSNLAFFIAFWAVARILKQNTNKFFHALKFLILVIAIGSSLFHSFARFWALFLDVGPISLFMLCYVIAYLTYITRLDTRPKIIVIVLFVLVTASLRVIRVEALNNSEFYFSPLLAIFLMSGDRYLRGDPATSAYGVALLFFLAALICRILDATVCLHFPTGTHFLWHIFNSGCLYYVMKGLVMASTRQSSSPASQG